MSAPIKNSHQPSATTIVALAGMVAATGTALWVRRQASKAERDNPPLGRFITVDGVRLHYLDEGNGPPVVLLHGNALQLQDFLGSGLVGALSQRHRVIVFDRPGFGHSERPGGRLWTPQTQAVLLQQALLQLGVERPVVVGHSWGALVALGMALKSPADVRGLVLVSGYYYPTARMEGPLTAPATIPVLGDAIRYTVSPLAGRLFLKLAVRKMFAPAPIPTNFFDAIPREMLLRPSQMKATAEEATFMVPAAAEFRDLYSGLDMPVTLIVGAGDKIVDVESHSAALHRELPDSTLLVVPGAGHMVHYAAPYEIAQAIEQLSGTGALYMPSIVPPASRPDNASGQPTEDATQSG